MRKFVLLFLVCLLVPCFSGCGVKTVKLRSFGFPSVAPDTVVVHVGKPPVVQYDEYLSMQEESGDYENIVEGFRRRAAAFGMDAIIVHVPENQLPKQGDSAKSMWAPMTGGKMNNLMATGIKYRKEK